MKRDLKELRRIEQICLAEAALATMDIERIGLLKVAEDCRRSVDEIEARAALQSRVRSFLGYRGYADTNWPGRVGVRSDRPGAVRRALSSLVSRSRVHHKGPPVHAGGWALFVIIALSACKGCALRPIEGRGRRLWSGKPRSGAGSLEGAQPAQPKR